MGKYAEYAGMTIQLRATPTGRYGVDLFDGDKCVASSGGEHAMEERAAKDRAIELVKQYRKLKPGPEPESGFEWKALPASLLRKCFEHQ